MYARLSAVGAALSVLVQQQDGVVAAPASQAATSSICKAASSILSSYHAFPTVSKWCTSYLSITPSTVTTTTTYTSPLTEYYGIVTSVTEQPDFSATTTVPSVTSASGTFTETDYVTDQAYSFVYYPYSTTVTKSVVCTRKISAATLAAHTACSCAGVTTPTVTSTSTFTTTGSLTIVTITATYLFDPTTTPPPAVTITDTASVSTVYSATTTVIATTTSTLVFYEQEYSSTVTSTVTTCTSTATATVLV